MSTHDKIELPPLPEWVDWPVTVSEMSASEIKEAMQAYALAAVAADRQQSRDREDAARYRWLCDKFGITKLPCAIERIIAGDVYVADGKAGIDEAIDHARRIEKDGE